MKKHVCFFVVVFTLLVGIIGVSPVQADELQPLPPEPQKITFKAEDGMELQGLYFPGAHNPSPMLVLMHWVGGDMSDWYEIAYWIQNRGGKSPEKVDLPWRDSSWFPVQESDDSWGVFIFTFRDCEGGCKQMSTAILKNWLKDAKAAVFKAHELEGVDPNMIITAGASIGADAAVDACYLLNEKFSGACRGAFPISPGSYLTLPFGDMVKKLGSLKPATSVKCLYSEQDEESAKVAKPLKEKNYIKLEYAGKRHGMSLIGPKVKPVVLSELKGFLDALNK